MSDEVFDENALEFGEEEEEERGVECDRGTTSLSSTNKRIKEMPIDRFSLLPDSLLVHILSFLHMKEAGRTSVLSKRWKFFWAEIPKLEFCEGMEIERKFDFVSWVNRTLDIRKEGYLEKFVVKFYNYNECFASDVDAWVDFSIKNKVKELVLLLNPLFECDYYTPPQELYSCSSLTCLHLTRGILAFSSVEWKSLTRLSLSDVELNQPFIDEVLSSCPVLSSLELEACWGFNRLEINSRCLSNLSIVVSDEEMEITAPYISCLNIKVCPKGTKLELKNISSVDRAFISLLEFYGYFTEELMGKVNEFLENFKQVKRLCVGRPCFEMLSIMAVNGLQLSQSRVRHLTLASYSEYKHNISGIIALLESSPNLEKLVINGYETNDEIANLDPDAKDDLDNDLLHLKKIRVINLADSNGEPLLTLAQILLNRAPALEEMIIVIDVKDTNNFVNIAQTLLTYPRSSTKAKIHLFSCV